jgi:copper/silver efflux system protein
MVVGLMPIFWATGRGADVIKPMAIPSVGGMTINLVTLFIVPCTSVRLREGIV